MSPKVDIECCQGEFGNSSYFKKGTKILHREDGPAIEYANGNKEWFLNGQRHREGGPAIEYTNGTKFWWLNGSLHREDGPAIEYANGTKEWLLNGNYHREDGPAIEYADGSQRWHLNGLLHREDGPAVELANGTKEWWLNDSLHREDGPAVELANGTKEWYLNGESLSQEVFDQKMSLKKSNVYSEKNYYGDVFFYKNGTTILHREDGPAIECANGTKEWYLNGKLHREDGPAIEYANGYKFWYLNGSEVSEEKFRQWKAETITKDNSKMSNKVHYNKDVDFITYDDGSVRYFNKTSGLLHREDGPAIIIPNTVSEWYRNGQLHREGGPAVIHHDDGCEVWYQNSLVHRTDGPAVYDDSGHEEWWVNGFSYPTRAVWNQAVIEYLKSTAADTSTSNNNVSKSTAKKEQTKMSNNILELLKGDGEDAMYRIAGTQMTKGTKAAILKVLENQGHGSERIKAFSEILDTEGGSAVIAMVLGMALHYIPQINQDPRAQRLAKEFRTKGMEIAGNAVADMALTSFLPVILESLNSLPVPTENAQLRVATPQVDNASPHEEEEAPVETKSKNRAVAP